MRTKSASIASFTVLAALAGCHQSDAPGAAGTDPVGATENATSPAANAPSVTSASSDDATSGNESGTEGDDPALPPAPLAASGTPGTPQAMVAEVDRELRSVRTTSYSHKTAIDESRGEFDYDCSGFVGYALEIAAPAASSELRAATVKRPLAKHFEGFFSSIPAGTTRGHWMHVAHVSDLRPGDVISWLQPADSTSKNTGHVLVVHGAVSSASDGSFVVPIADSSSIPHRPGDSREQSQTTGLGTGSIVLVTDASGAPTGFRWSTGKKSRLRDTSVALGRLVP